jgi:glycosyltransferase involved in cell wall biosynthesis
VTTPISSEKLSVVICTHNRAKYAVECVEALLRCNASEQLDIVVVDNASSRTEREFLVNGLATLPVRFEEQPLPGVSHARNMGASLARSEWFAYVDDDALAFPDWVVRARSLVAAAGERDGLIGGAVLPRWPDHPIANSVPPERLGSRWRTLLSLVDSERVAHGAAIPEVVACNMLVRRRLVEEVGGFHTALGRTPGSLLGGEEIELARRIAAHGYRVSFDPSLRVYHQIHAERLGTGWIRKRAEAEGELLWRCSPSAKTAAKVFLSIPYLALASTLRSLPNGLPRDYDHHVRLWNNVGFAKSAITALTNRTRLQEVTSAPDVP